MTARSVGLRSRRLCQFAFVLLAATACAAANPPAAGAKGAGPASEPRTASPFPTGAKGGSPSPIPGIADPSARCVARPSGAPMVLVGGAIYEVGDPVHPKLLCQVANTRAHLFTGDTFEYVRRSGPDGTEVVLHSIGSGSERVVAGWPIKLLDTDGRPAGDWTPDGNTAATLVRSTDADGDATMQVWLFAQPNKTLLYEFRLGAADCICQFGLPAPTLAFSADGQFLVAGWPVGKGSVPSRVYRVADASLVQTLDPADVQAMWSRTGHRLFLNARSWTPEDGFAPLNGATYWPYMAGLSRDGSQVAYTDYRDLAAQTDVRVYLYDFGTDKTRMLVDKPRSEVTFVKDGWVWYLEEGPCSNCMGQTGPTGKVFTMDLSTGVEQLVVFAAGESPAELQSGWGPGQFWPNS